MRFAVTTTKMAALAGAWLTAAPALGAPHAPAPLSGPSLLAPQGPRAPDALATGPDDTDEARPYALRPLPGGGYQYDGPRFDAYVAPDGQVVFKDHHATLERLQLGPVTLGKSARSGKWSVEDWLPGSNAAARRDAEDPYRYHAIADPLGRDGLVRGLPPAPILVSSTVRMDFVEEFARMMGGRSPYRHEQARFLAATSELRTRMAAETKARLVRQALAELPARLDALWAEPGYTGREKRRVVFLLWQEVDPADGDGAPAAAVIEDWVRKRLPRGGPQAYAADELAGLNAARRLGTPPFAPYGPASAPPAESQRDSR
jgi:hypothetical protein